MNIKKLLLVLVVLMTSVAFLTITGCEGPAGPAGADGTNGTNGTDANAHCTTCHSDANWESIEGLFALSGHAAGGAVGYAGGESYCAYCHSHEGFMNSLDGIFVGIDNPTAWQCGTCHSDHESLEEGLSAPLHLTSGITSVEGVDIDFDGPSNLCINCHQARRAYTTYTSIDTVWTTDSEGNDSIDFVVPEGSVYISSSHAGPHYGVQAEVLNGLSGFGNSSTMEHLDLGCVSCHMGTSAEADGGHSFHPNLAGNCTPCHTDAAATVEASVASFDTRMAAIADALVAEGALSESYGGVKVVVTQGVFEAFWNYKVCYSDHSHGVHNPAYINTLLSRAEALLGL